MLVSEVRTVAPQVPTVGFCLRPDTKNLEAGRSHRFRAGPCQNGSHVVGVVSRFRQGWTRLDKVGWWRQIRLSQVAAPNWVPRFGICTQTNQLTRSISSLLCICASLCSAEYYGSCAWLDVCSWLQDLFSTTHQVNLAYRPEYVLLYLMNHESVLKRHQFLFPDRKPW